MTNLDSKNIENKIRHFIKYSCNTRNLSFEIIEGHWRKSDRNLSYVYEENIFFLSLALFFHILKKKLFKRNTLPKMVNFSFFCTPQTNYDDLHDTQSTATRTIEWINPKFFRYLWFISYIKFTKVQNTAYRTCWYAINDSQYLIFTCIFAWVRWKWVYLDKRIILHWWRKKTQPGCLEMKRYSLERLQNAAKTILIRRKFFREQTSYLNDFENPKKIFD